MNKALRVADYLSHILQAIERIDRHTAGLEQIGFLASELIQDAVIRNLEVIGEAANNIRRVNPQFAMAHPEIPWSVMYAMRNHLSHGYDQVDLQIVWKTVRRDLSQLHRLVSAATADGGATRAQ